MKSYKVGALTRILLAILIFGIPDFNVRFISSLRPSNFFLLLLLPIGRPSTIPFARRAANAFFIL
jgi:hypothetical protein